MKHIEFNGLIYTKDNKTGYYLNSTTRKRLHRVVYEYYNGEIPKGYEIHHIDQNKENNDISNLKLVSKKEHIKIHKELLTEEQKQWKRNNLNEKARPEAIKWHKSKEGKEWHKEQYKKSLGNRKEIEFVCEYCGNKYKTIKCANNKFCSNKCKSANRRKLGLDNIKKECIICGTEFETSKYSKATRCKNCKSKKY